MTQRMSAAEYRKLVGGENPDQGKKLKYRNKPVEKENKRFDSTGEALYWETLRLREEDGEIRDLRRQPRYPLYTRTGECIGEYIGDFQFVEIGLGGNERIVCEDFKGVRTAMYKWKIKHARADNPGIEFREVTRDE